MKHLLLAFCLAAPAVMAQPQFSIPHGLYDNAPLTVSIADDSADGTIRYTTDSSEPTSASSVYSGPLTIGHTTILRCATFNGEERISDIATATYLFPDDVLAQDNKPEGYPSEWGQYSQMWGTAKADYEMDPEMTNDPTLRPKIIEGLKQLPILSIVTDRDNLFSHENDPERGGIYIFTGPPVGDNTGHGWTRPASVELIPSTLHPSPDISTTCGLRLHGGHGRVAEKNPKHSFRLVFKEEYGPKSLKAPLFGDDEPSKFDQLVLRCHFGNSWQHWNESNRKRAQFTRDVWARRIQRKMGHTSVNALYVNVFLNGMYWGLYNIAERVDDQFGKDHLGGSKEDIDVIKIEEDGGYHIEAGEGDLEAWELMTATARQVSAIPDDNGAYYRLRGLDSNGRRDSTMEVMLDIDDFIDYMLINQYGGNTDWDHHNWYAIRRKGAGSQGFRFLCWDSESTLVSSSQNVMDKDNGQASPTGIFQNLMKNKNFARRYFQRAKELLSKGGVLSEESAVAVWDSLYHTIDKAIYAEAARWGDYRRDVHPWQSQGQFYTVDDFYLPERERMLTGFFPARSKRVLQQITEFVNPAWLDIDQPMVADATRSSEIYDLQGRRLTGSPTKRGIYIKGGKKVVR